MKYIGIKQPSKTSNGNIGDVWEKEGDFWICKTKPYKLTEEQFQSDLKNEYLKPILNELESLSS